jgi:hypothetical protein
MNTLRYRITVLSLLTTFVLGMLTAGAQAQTRLDIRAASKAEFKKRSSRMDESKYKLPEWWIEVPKGGLPKVGFPNHERVGISPIPTPIPHPVSHYERVGISPIPTPIPHPVPHHERDEVELGNLSSFMEQLLEMYEDAVLQGDLGAADMIEELLIIVPDYIIVPDF